MHDSKAEQLENALKNKGECNDPAVRPLLGVADALRRDADTSSEHLDPATATNQRIVLMNMAEAKLASQKAQQSEPPKKTPKPIRLWLGAAATVLAVLVVAVIASDRLKTNGLIPFQPTQSDATKESLVRMIIPTAHAGDAFTLIAESKDKNGVSVDSTFKVASKVEMTAVKLEQSLHLVPALDKTGAEPQPINVKVEQLSTDEFRVRPANVLESNTVYKISLAAAVEGEDGSLTNRDFSWAVQTKNVFRITSSIPGPSAVGVPVNTVVEFTMSLENWENPDAYFELQPKVDGKFEVHGRSLSFVPKKPLENSRLYTAVLKKGLKLKDGSLALEDDYRVQFETEAVPSPTPQTATISPFRWIYETSPNREFAVRVNYENIKGDIDVTGYFLSQEQAKQFLTEDSVLPDFASESRQKLFEKFATQNSFTVKGTVDQEDPKKYYAPTYLRLPKVAAGHYVLKLQPAGGKVTWLYVESTDLATYTVADKDTLLVWAMNIDTKRPLSDLNVAYGSVSAKTDKDGLARLPVPPGFSATTTKDEILEIGSGALSSLVILSAQNGFVWSGYDYGGGMDTTNDQTIAYVYADRPIYRTSDAVELFGLVQDRASKRAGEDVTVELTRPGYSIFWETDRSEGKIYRQANVTADENGFFQSKMDWTNLSPGYYLIALRRGGLTVTSRYIEIRDFIKPLYSLEIVSEKEAVFAGEEVNGEIRATFFDGTPVSNLALNFRSEYGNASSSYSVLTTDETGRAQFKLSTYADKNCTLTVDGGCRQRTIIWMEADPKGAEDAEIRGTGYVSVYNSHAIVNTDSVVKDGVATINFSVQKVDLSKLTQDNSWDIAGEPLRNAKLVGKIFEREWKTTQVGTGYNYIEKTTYPIYRYDVDIREVANFDMVTDGSGKAQTVFGGMKKNLSYIVVANVQDEQGNISQGRDWMAIEWFNSANSVSNNYISLQADDLAQNEYRGRHLGENVSLQFFKGDQKIPTAETPSVLYIQTHLGLGQTTVTNSTNYQFKFGEEHIPNMTVRAVIFTNGGFVQRDSVVFFENSDRDLKIEITTDKNEYAPSAKAKLHVKITAKDGQPQKDARTILSLVDEAVFAVQGAWDTEENPLAYIYRWVSNGVITSSVSHWPVDQDEDFYGGGGAEKGGGGGGDQIRRNFKDTAAFKLLVTDRNGEADVEIALPDNLTSWRITAVAATPGLYAGSASSNLKVTKPVFVDAVVPSVLLVKDKPVLKLRAFGTGLTSNDKVTFTVDAPTLGVKNQSVDGTVGQATYLGIDTLTEGDHALVIRVKTQRGTDAFEKKVKILNSRFYRDESVETELAPGTSLPDPVSSREVEVAFIPKTRAQYLSKLRSMTRSWSQRLEAKYAKLLANGLLKEYFNVTDTEKESLLRYQMPSGGLAILPYASEDVELTSKIAALDKTNVFDHASMAQYLWGISQKQGITREEAIRATAGLAALGHPVLNQLNEYAAQGDLNWREQLAVIRGLEASGDSEAARARLDKFLSKAEDRNNTMLIRVSDKDREVTEATAEAAAYASLLQHPAASKLNAWLEKSWATDTLTELDRIAYLIRVVPAAVGRNVKIGYSVGGDEKIINLVDGNFDVLKLTNEEVKTFKVTQVDGPAIAVFTRRVTNKPTPHRDLSITRTYGNISGLKEGESVNIKLELEFSTLAPDGCYTVRDHLPAGLSPFINNYGGYWGNSSWYPNEFEDGAVSFVVCRAALSKVEHQTINYQARVVARGTYTAEPAVLQSMVLNSVSALSLETQIEIK